jgi:predicted DCC family thiol-disulfide oxidoreductase YuxK
LQGATFQSRFGVDARDNISKHIVVETLEGTLLTRADAWVHVLRMLGGGWKVIGEMVAAIPRPLRDAVYELIARFRHRLFGRPEELCPSVAPDLRARFDP